MLSAAAFQFHILLTPLVNPIFEQFSFNFQSFKSQKSTFLIERVVVFQVFAIFVSDVVFDLSSVHFWPFGTVLGPHLGGSWGRLGASWSLFGGVLRPLRVLWAHLRESLAPRCPQDAHKRPQKAPKITPKSPKMLPRGPPETAQMPREAPKIPFKSSCVRVFPKGRAVTPALRAQ